jgi:GNAT superfamily N-acetyltransferase
LDCGQAALDEWLQVRAGQYERKNLSRTYVAVRAGTVEIVGYYALSTHRVRFSDLSGAEAKGLPSIDIPAILLGRLAVDKSLQGQGLGAYLLIDALRRAYQVSEQIGVRVVEVDAIDDAAQKFYVKFGFLPLADDKRHLFLPIHVIERLGFGE